MKYKEGDKVLIKSLDWYNEAKKSLRGGVILKPYHFSQEMKGFCGRVLTIKSVRHDHYEMEDCYSYRWTDEMIEGLAEEETKPKYEDEVNGEYYSTPICLVRSNGYQFVDENGNVINARKIVLEKKKKEYPKTYGGCCDTLYRNSRHDECYEACLQGYPMQTFARLLICRDAYWKIAGEEMGLEKPWKPDWTDHELKYCIKVIGNTLKCVSEMNIQCILAFPTEEMRDAFKENFDPDIEICKEFL